MRSFPLVRSTYTNEHLMAAVFAVLLLYLLPQFSKDPARILSFALVLLFALIMDEAIGFLRYKRPVCAVSAAVTAGIIEVFSVGVPILIVLAGITAALVFGKHIWGGTGKNPINPAVTGLLAIALISGNSLPPIMMTGLVLPALLLSLPFLLVRPFAGAGIIAGMAFSFIFGGSMPLTTAAATAIFIGCLVITDPTTVTSKPVIGFFTALLAGLAPYIFGNAIISLLLAIIVFNLVSSLVDEFNAFNRYSSIKVPLRLKKILPYSSENTAFFDLTAERKEDSCSFERSQSQILTNKEGIEASKHYVNLNELLGKIEECKIFGCGGAAFPAEVKIRTAADSKATNKYFIVNGVECDPGLIHDQWLLHNHLDGIIKGIIAISSCIGFKDICLAVKNTAGLELPEPIRLYKTKDRYPAGAEKLLIESVLHRKLVDGSIPAAEGILVLNVQTVYFIYEALYLGMKQKSKYLTVLDTVNGRCSVARADLGMKVFDLVKRIYNVNYPVFTGGGAMQAQSADETAVIEATTNFIASARYPRYKESPFCSDCGLCRAVCPAGLKVNVIADLVDKGKCQETSGYHPQSCMSCGSCSYVCLAGRNLSTRVQEARRLSS
ncbi:MAG: RnfABCDGE type electron transport complex subunit D [Bacillota bacterium]